jgi:hypothetical protein
MINKVHKYSILYKIKEYGDIKDSCVSARIPDLMKRKIIRRKSGEIITRCLNLPKIGDILEFDIKEEKWYIIDSDK